MGVWIETPFVNVAVLFKSHTLYGCVDWNHKIPFEKVEPVSHTLYGCVDWNLLKCLSYSAL